PRHATIHLAFFIPLRPPPPRPTLFPYTTLFRSYTDPRFRAHDPAGRVLAEKSWGRTTLGHDGAVEYLGDFLQHHLAVVTECRSRSEEHTSELQSRGHLVCRLLLEKKKNLLLSWP